MPFKHYYAPTLSTSRPRLFEFLYNDAKTPKLTSRNVEMKLTRSVEITEASPFRATVQKKWHDEVRMTTEETFE